MDGHPGGKGFSRVHAVSCRKGRRERRAAENPRLKPSRSRESLQKRDLESEGIALPAGPRTSPKTRGGQEPGKCLHPAKLRGDWKQQEIF